MLGFTSLPRFAAYVSLPCFRPANLTALLQISVTLQLISLAYFAPLTYIAVSTNVISLMQFISLSALTPLSHIVVSADFVSLTPLISLSDFTPLSHIAVSANFVSLTQFISLTVITSLLKSVVLLGYPSSPCIVCILIHRSSFCFTPHASGGFSPGSAPDFFRQLISCGWRSSPVPVSHVAADPNTLLLLSPSQQVEQDQHCGNGSNGDQDSGTVFTERVT